MHDPRLTYIYMRKDSLLQCMHEAAAQHRTPSISPISLQSKTKLGFNFVEPLWYGSSWPRSQSERGKSNLEWKKNTFILSNYNELVDILSSGMETPCWTDSSAKWGMHIVHIENQHSILCILSILFDIFCILLLIQDSQLQTCILPAYSAY